MVRPSVEKTVCRIPANVPPCTPARRLDRPTKRRADVCIPTVSIADDKQLRQHSHQKLQTDGRGTVQVTAAQPVRVRHGNVAREGVGQASTSRTLVRRRTKRRFVDAVLESVVGQRRSSGHQLHSGKAGAQLDHVAKGNYFSIGIAIVYGIRCFFSKRFFDSRKIFTLTS